MSDRLCVDSAQYARPRISGKVYENALMVEVRAAGLLVVQQHTAKVHYRDVLVGEYFVELLVEGVLLVELKTVNALTNVHRPQCANCLKAIGLRQFLLLNFGKTRLEIKGAANGM